MVGAPEGEEGLYHRGTRFLWMLEFGFGPVRPLLLSSNITSDNFLLAIDMTNPDFVDLDGNTLHRGAIHIFKSIFLHRNSCYERLRVISFSDREVLIPLTYRFQADFKDVFEVRGHSREKRGELRPPVWKDGRLELTYLGLDQVERATSISFSAEGTRSVEANGDSVTFLLQLGAEAREIYLCYDCSISDLRQEVDSGPPETRFRKVFREVEEELKTERAMVCRLKSSNEAFNDWICRSQSDLHMMTSLTPSGPYPYAGVPWFSTTFGRDGIITALQNLWVSPGIAKGVLRFLAETQATEFSDERDAEPGKILHEAREGEMAALGEIPYRRYYGAVDSTPLFVHLAGEYFRATGDLELIRSIWPNVENALLWIERYGDSDGDGFVEYSRRSRNGLVSQGWKDSADSVFHADGSGVEGPVALCEVQGYVYQAKRSAALLADALGWKERAGPLLEAAESLKRRFNEAFWCPEIGTFALALDGKKRQCKVATSNAGHCLFSGIALPKHAPSVARSLMSDRLFCGWGIRTVAEGEARYNPMSYHNGSVWPHDTSIVAMGLSRYGFKRHACRILEGMLDVSRTVDLNRLPELFCGFDKRPGQGPTLYPMSCAPQAWAAGSLFLLLQACLGLELNALEGKVVLDSPCLPDSVDRLRLEGLLVGASGEVSLEIVRRESDVALHVLRRRGDVSVVSIQ
jgi:glycogen debranching enzyme